MRFSLILLLAAAAIGAKAQCLSLRETGAEYTQNFDTLGNAGTANTALPAGWQFAESGASARNNSAYAASDGSGNSGDVYSFGATGSIDRALGTLRSGTLIPVVGACFTNNTGAMLTTLSIRYTGEMWRAGVANRGAADRLDFQISTDAVVWTDVDALDFTSPTIRTAVGATDGNEAAFRTAKGHTISGLSIADGATFHIRWTDFDISSSDDGLAVDDFSLTPLAGVAPALSISDAWVVEGDEGQRVITFTVSLDQPAPEGGVSFHYATADGSASAPLDYLSTAGGGFVPPGEQTTGIDVIVNGDADPEGDEIFFVNLADVPGAVISDGQGEGRIVNDDEGAATCEVTRTIPEIQGLGSQSPVNGAIVTTRGIVTALRGSGYYLQSEGDADPATSDGILVFTASAPPLQAVIGNELCVRGTVTEFRPAADPNQQPLTELTASTVLGVLATGRPLPEPVVIRASDTDPAGGLDVLERLEGMRVRVNALEAVAPSAANGVFYGVAQGVARPFREPGVPVGDPLPAGAPAGIPRFDANPERVRVVGALDVTAGAVVGPVTGVLDYAFRTYTILADPGVINVSNVPAFTAAPEADPAELTVASLNMERFFDDRDDAGVSDAVLPTAQYQNRIAKAARLIRDVLRLPDVIGVQEVENLAVLQAVAARLPGYEAHLAEGNDVGGIDVGFLVKTSRVTVLDVIQEGKQDAALHDRPPLVLRAAAKRADSDSALPFTVIVNHLRSLIDIEDPRVRAKRRAQAEFLANLIAARQKANPAENLVVLGDFNAFQFNDGFVDVMGTVKGTPAPADQVVEASADLVNPDMVNLADTLPPTERYSYIFDGNAQILDHILVNQPMAGRLSRFLYTHANAGFPEVLRGDASRPERLTDHDQPVAYFKLPLNRRPLAASQTEYVIPGVAKNIALRVSDADGDILAFTMLTQPQFGTVTFNSVARTATYTAAAITAADSFTYTATDSSGLSATATVFVQPLANADASVVLTAQTGQMEDGLCAPGKIFRVNSTWRNLGPAILTNVAAKLVDLSPGDTL
ncbi:MAG: Calx-beta domain-containing protein, partial [Bryobacteraceae bacterium]|nr:Calx-beta domain-containing protein [Bryobacteraceae bacterium]